MVRNVDKAVESQFEFLFRANLKKKQRRQTAFE